MDVIFIQERAIVYMQGRRKQNPAQVKAMGLMTKSYER